MFMKCQEKVILGDIYRDIASGKVMRDYVLCVCI